MVLALEYFTSEINRGMVKGLLNSDYSTYDAYSTEFAHRKYLEAIKGKEGTLKITKNRKLIEYVENSMLNDKNSPYVALENAEEINNPPKKNMIASIRYILLTSLK